MKKALLFVSIFSIFLAVACTSRTKNDTAVQKASPYDTTGLAAFQDWQFQNERKDASEYMQEQAVAAAPVKKASHKKAPVKKAPSAPVITTPEQPKQSESGTVNNDQGGNQSGNMGTETTNEAKVEEKKGISNAAKGTAIGAAGGAILGAVINKKNRVLGGVIGGVIGGGVGYGIGRKMDKNEGR